MEAFDKYVGGRASNSKIFLKVIIPHISQVKECKQPRSKRYKKIVAFSGLNWCSDLKTWLGANITRLNWYKIFAQNARNRISKVMV